MKDLSDEFLGIENDILCFGFQEMVELSAQQVMTTDPRKLLLWQQKIQEHLVGHDYIFLRSCQLVGLSLLIFLRKNLASVAKKVQMNSCKTGLAGLSGNKGSSVLSSLRP